MAGTKRRADSQNAGAIVASKKRRVDDGSIVRREGTSNELIAAGIKRTSNLASPIMQLGNHDGEIYTVKFSPDGQSLASGSFDKTIFFWNVFGECENYNVFRGHKNAILDLHYATDGQTLYSASADKTCIIWDIKANGIKRRFREHTAIINTCHPARRGPEILATGSDDTTVKVWDSRAKRSTMTIKHAAAVTSVSFSDDASKLFTAGLDSNIYCWDLATQELEYSMRGHHETITNLCLSPDGNFLVSNSMDNTVRIWDVKPFVSQEAESRETMVLRGAMHNYESNLLKCGWSPDGTRIAAGSSDKLVYVWDAKEGTLLYKLPGHKGSVNEVAFHPNPEEPIIASASSDRTIFLGEINPSS